MTIRGCSAFQRAPSAPASDADRYKARGQTIQRLQQKIAHYREAYKRGAGSARPTPEPPAPCVGLPFGLHGAWVTICLSEREPEFDEQVGPSLVEAGLLYTVAPRWVAYGDEIRWPFEFTLRHRRAKQEAPEKSCRTCTEWTHLGVGVGRCAYRGPGTSAHSTCEQWSEKLASPPAVPAAPEPPAPEEECPHWSRDREPLCAVQPGPHICSYPPEDRTRCYLRLHEAERDRLREENERLRAENQRLQRKVAHYWAAEEKADAAPAPPPPAPEEECPRLLQGQFCKLIDLGDGDHGTCFYYGRPVDWQGLCSIRALAAERDRLWREGKLT